MARKGERFTMTRIRHSCGHRKSYRKGHEPHPDYLDPGKPCHVCRIKAHAEQIKRRAQRWSQ